MLEESRTAEGAEAPVQDASGGTPAEKAAKKPKFLLDIEGVEHPWDRDTITTEEIIDLGGWDRSLGAIEIDKDNNERALKPGEVVELKPGQGFSKKIKFKRG
jgi:hypothetical protein